MTILLTRARLLEFAETQSAEDRTTIIELAGKWRHGYVPLDAVAWAIKMKQARGDGKRRTGIARGSQNHLEQYRHEGAARPRGKARTDVGEQLRNADAAMAARGKRRATPPAAPTVADHVKAQKARETARQYTRKTGADLRNLHASGDRLAGAEIERRAAAKAEKRPRGVLHTPPAKAAAAKPADLSAMSIEELGAHANKSEDHRQAVLGELRSRLAAKEAAKPAEPAPAAPVAKPKRKPSATYLAYLQAREEQDTRFENSRNGYKSKDGKMSEEEKAYYGLGENMGRGAVEQRITYRSFLEGRRQSPDEKDHQAAYDAGAKLGRKHGLQDAPGHVADPQLAEVQAQHQEAHHESLLGGYTDGLILGGQQREKRQAEKAARDNAKPVENLKQSELRAAAQSPDPERRKAVEAEILRRHEARQAGKPRRGLNDYRPEGSAAKAAESAPTSVARQETPDEINARYRAERAADPNAAAHLALVHKLNNPGLKMSRDELRTLATSTASTVHPEQKAKAAKALEQRSYEEAKGRLSSQTDEQLRGIVASGNLKNLPPDLRRGAARYIRERTLAAKPAGAIHLEGHDSVNLRTGEVTRTPSGSRAHGDSGQMSAAKLEAHNKGADQARESTNTALTRTGLARRTQDPADHATAAEAHRVAAANQRMMGNNATAAKHDTVAEYHRTRAGGTRGDIAPVDDAEKALRGDRPGTTSRGLTHAESQAEEAAFVQHRDAQARANRPRTPVEIAALVESDPSKLTMDELQRVSKLNGRHAPTVNREIARREAAAGTPGATVHAAPAAVSLKETHPVGMQVDARQPGIDAATPGVVTKHLPNGMLEVGYRDRHGNAQRGTFNPSHVTPSRRAELIDMPEHGGPEQTRRAAGATSHDKVAAGMPVGQRVQSEWGPGTVTGSTDRSTTVKYDSGDELNHAKGTPGHDRIRKIEDAPKSEARRFGEAANAGGAANIRQAQADERAAAARRVKPVQGEMFGAAGEHQPDMFEQAAAEAKPEPRIRIEHSGDGTTVHGTTREDAPKLKEQGFRWSRNLGAWYLPRTQLEHTRAAKARALQASLGSDAHTVTGDLAKSGTGAEQAQARIARAQEIVAEQQRRAEKLSGEAQTQFDKSHRATDGIPFGQPILVGHHSERAHRAALERSHNAMGKGVEAQRAAERAAGRAESAAARARLEEDPRFAARRAERNAAELRKVERSLQGADPNADHTKSLQAMRADLAASVERDRAVVEAKGNGYGKHNVQAGDLVHYRGDWHLVHRTNPKTVALPTGYSWTDKVDYTQLTGHRSLDDPAISTEQLRRLEAKPGTSAAVKARIAAILQQREGH